MTTPRALFLGLAMLASLSAQTPTPAPAPAPETPASEQPADTPEAQAAQPKRPRAISSDLAASLAASMPKYHPPKPKAPPKEEPTPEEQPKNQIIRLPRVVVEGQRPPVFNEREVHTSKGLAELAVKRYFSETGLALNFYTIPLFGMTTEAYAMMLYEQDERLRHLNDANDKVSILRETDPAAAAELQDDVNATFIRSSGFGR